ncbi:MAG: SH3 domain-containing protein [Acidobacteriota bacterium]
MTRRAVIVGSLVILIALFGGFWTGRLVEADITSPADPGSTQDPLVTQSYVDSQLRSQVQTLQTQITALQNRIALLEARPATGSQTSTPVVTPGNPSGTGNSTGTVTPGTSIKKIYTKPGIPKANVRSGPGTSYPIVTKLNPGEAAQYVSERSGWYCIKTKGGKAGWVSKDVTVLK